MAIAVFVTIPPLAANRLAKKILKEKVGACVNIIKGIKSYFWWEKKIDEAKESLLIIKTKDNLFLKLKKVIKNNHPYNVPEIISFKINQINREYLNWLESSCKSSPAKI